jgi:hypothetical protein
MRIILAISLFSFSISCSAQNDKWDKFESAFEYYLANPTHANALNAYNLFPDLIETKDYPSKAISECIMYTTNELETIIAKGDRDALRLGFRLYKISDGAYQESLDWTIGGLIIDNPILFLEELNNYRHSFCDLYGLVGNNGPESYGNDKIYWGLTEKKIESLKKINIPELNNLRKECLEYLSRSYKER